MSFNVAPSALSGNLDFTKIEQLDSESGLDSGTNFDLVQSYGDSISDHSPAISASSILTPNPPIIMAPASSSKSCRDAVSMVPLRVKLKKSRISKPCSVCGKTFSASSALNYHMKLHSNERPYKCEVCGKGFIQKVHWRIHTESAVCWRLAAPLPVQTEGQPNALSVSVEDTDLQNSSTVAKAVVASVCDSVQAVPNLPVTLEPAETLYETATSKNMTTHLVSSRINGEFLEESVNNINSTNHQSSASVSSMIDCPNMTTTAPSFGRVSGLSRPKIPRLPIRARASSFEHRGDLVQCPQCPATLRGQLRLLEHICAVHQGIPTYGTAEKTPSNESNDPQKLNVAELRKDTWCTICSTNFSCQSALSTHMKSHNEQNNFPCDVCGKRFYSQFDLIMHSKVHQSNVPGPQSFTCKICEKEFSSRRTLKVHLRLHTGERPYPCKFCPRSFIQRVHLMRHVAAHIRQRCPSTLQNESLNQVLNLDQSQMDTITDQNPVEPSLSNVSIHSTLRNNNVGYINESENNTSTFPNDFSVKQEPEDEYPKECTSEFSTNSAEQSARTKEHELSQNRYDEMVVWSQRSLLSPAAVPSTGTIDKNGANTVENAKLNKSIEPRNQISTTGSGESPCPNCEVVKGELEQLKYELETLKQLLNGKINIIRKKIDGIQHKLH